MKNKIILALLLAGAGFGKDAQAMGGAGKFAKQLFGSKTAAVAVASGIATGATLYEMNRFILEKGGTSLSPEVQEEVRVHFKSLGVNALEIKDAEGITEKGLFATSFGGKCVLLIPAKERAVLEGTSVDGITKREVLATLEHEAFHMVNQDGVKQAVRMASVPPTVIMVGKMIRVLGGSKKLTVFGGCAVLPAAMLGITYCSRQLEQHADDVVKDAAGLAGYLEKKEKKVIDALMITYAQAGISAEYIEKSINNAGSSYFASHPSTVKRIAILNRRAKKE